MKFEVGDRVRDKFKVPRPGDETVQGEVIEVSEFTVTVRWDSHPGIPATFSKEAAGALMEKINE